MLSNRKYIGEAVYGKCTQHIGKCTPVPEDNWAIVENAFELLVSKYLFRKACQKLNFRKSPMNIPNEEMLVRLKRLWTEKGILTAGIIDNAKYTPSACTYKRHFGSLREACSLIGYDENHVLENATEKASNGIMLRYAGHNQISKDEILKRLERLLREKGRLSHSIIKNCPYVPSATLILTNFGSLGNAYKLVGYTPGTRALQLIEVNVMRHKRLQKS